MVSDGLTPPTVGNTDPSQTHKLRMSQLRHSALTTLMRGSSPMRGAGASTIGMLMGLALYGTVYVLPVYLAQTHDYDALQVGEVVMWRGLPQLLIFPLVPLAMRYVRHGLAY